MECNEWEEGTVLGLPPRGQREEALGKGGDLGASCGLNIWVAWCSLRSAWSPPGTTQAPFCKSGSTPIAAWSTRERPQSHKGSACAGLVMEAEFVRAPVIPAPWGDPPRCSLDGGELLLDPWTRVLSRLPADAWENGWAPKLCAQDPGGIFSSFPG